jgi:DNA-binding response OmpR family regulator
VKKSILLVDDEPQMGSLLEMSLDDVHVVQVRNRQEALEVAPKVHPELVLLDLALGREDGLEILPSLRKDPALKKVPVLVFSVHPSRRAEAMRAGADGFIPKPFRGDDLRAKINSHLNSA